MRKSVLVISIYFLFSFLVINLMIPKELTFLDYSNLLFLNVKTYSAFNLSEFNFQFITSFSLWFILLLYFLIKTVTESVSFMGMVLYRQGKSKTVRDRALSNLGSVLVLIGFTIGIILILYLMWSRFCVYDGFLKDYLTVFFYLVRFFSIVFCLIFYYELGNMLGKSGTRYFIVYALFFAMVLIDLSFKFSIITFSGDMKSEFLLLVGTVCLGFLLCLCESKRFTQKGDIL